MKTLSLDELDGIPVFGTLVWKPVRKTLGVTAFGINAYTAASAGDEIVEALTETDEAVIHYQLACVESLAGNRERALAELQVAADAAERFRMRAQTDEDFDSIRDDPRFPR